MRSPALGRFQKAGQILFLLTLPLSAQSQRFEVKPSLVRGVEVFTPGSAEFKAAILRLVPEIETRKQGASLLAKSFLVKNTGTRSIDLFVARYDFANPGGKGVAGVLWQDFRQVGRLFRPGDLWIVTPTNTITDQINRAAVSAPALAEAATFNHLGTLRSSPYLSPSVDAVLFSDGEFAGPDASGIFQALSQQRDAYQSLRGEMQAMRAASSDAIRERLEGILKQPYTQADYHAQLMRRKMAVSLMPGLLSGGYEGLEAVFNARWKDAAFLQIRR
jgi:hypothetical protein